MLLGDDGRRFLFCVFVVFQRAACQPGFRKPPDSEGFTSIKSPSSMLPSESVDVDEEAKVCAARLLDGPAAR